MSCSSDTQYSFHWIGQRLNTINQISLLLFFLNSTTLSGRLFHLIIATFHRLVAYHDMSLIYFGGKLSITSIFRNQKDPTIHNLKQNSSVDFVSNFRRRSCAALHVPRIGSGKIRFYSQIRFSTKTLGYDLSYTNRRLTPSRMTLTPFLLKERTT